VASPALLAQSRRAMTVDDLITTVRLAEPTLSPDGSPVLYVRTVTNADTGKRNADIWSVAADGSTPPKALFTGDSSETSPVFSGDGKRVAFISSRAGGPQVFIANIDGSD